MLGRCLANTDYVPVSLTFTKGYLKKIQKNRPTHNGWTGQKRREEMKNYLNYSRNRANPEKIPTIKIIFNYINIIQKLLLHSTINS